jgi:hypothetical protein
MAGFVLQLPLTLGKGLALCKMHGRFHKFSGYNGKKTSQQHKYAKTQTKNDFEIKSR